MWFFDLKSVSLKIKPLLYIAMYCNGSILMKQTLACLDILKSPSAAMLAKN